MSASPGPVRDRTRDLALRALHSRAGTAVLSEVVRASYARYLRTDSTPALGYRAMRKLHASGPDALDRFAERSALEAAPRAIDDSSGIITDPFEDVLTALRVDGIAVLQGKLPTATCAALAAVAERSPCTLTERQPGAPSQARFDATHPQAVRYDVPEPSLIADPAVQALVADRSVLSIAQSYLGCLPVQDLVAMWWSAPSTTASAAAAQQFHFDLDRLRFLKLFVYLTDVGPDSGPHVFVRGSHRSLPSTLRADRRFSDAEVLDHFDPSSLMSVAGDRGTMFLADTRGLHKGLNVAVGHRLVFQMEYASSLFGAKVERVVPTDVGADLQRAIAEFPTAYRRFTPEI